ncbi:MAG: universal stress protein [Ramlibacter sp.]|nr:universal stress protein [Ramlibacter sp.]
MHKTLIAIDGSELSLDAVRHALDLRSRGLRTGFVLVNVQEPPSLYEMLTLRDPERLADLGASAGEHLLAAARQLCDAAGADYEFEVAEGDPAHTLVDVAERYGCSSIIVGARGKGGTESGWLGSVSHELMHMSPMPVTVIKHPQAEDMTLRASDEPQQELQPVVVGLA